MPAPQPNKVQRPIDDIDRAILEQLERRGRMPNNALAEAVGIAPSTCLGRMRALVDDGVILGFHADIAPWALGRDLQAVIAVKLHPDARSALGKYTESLIHLPEVRNVFFVAGGFDFLVHVAAPNTEGLRQFVVDRLSSNPEVASTETNLVFEHRRGDLPPPTTNHRRRDHPEARHTRRSS